MLVVVAFILVTVTVKLKMQLSLKNTKIWLVNHFRYTHVNLIVIGSFNQEVVNFWGTS